MDNKNNDKIKIERVYDFYPFIDKINIKTSDLWDPCYLVTSPFANCQTFSLNNTQLILKNKLEDRIEIFKEIFKINLSKTQCIIDIKANIEVSLDEVFNNDEYIFKQYYTNSTGSSMLMVLIKTERLKKL